MTVDALKTYVQVRMCREKKDKPIGFNNRKCFPKHLSILHLTAREKVLPCFFLSPSIPTSVEVPVVESLEERVKSMCVEFNLHNFVILQILKFIHC